MKHKLRTTASALHTRALLVLVAVFTAVLVPISGVQADVFDDQIRALQNEVNQYQAEAGKLRAQATSLQNELNALASEKRALQVQIDINTAKMEQLNKDIQENERKLLEQKENLSINLRSMYLENSVTPLEMVASSKSLSDFIDRQEYRNKIRDKVQQNLVAIRKTKDDLAKQKVALEQTLADQNSQREKLAAKEAEQADLLAQTQGQEAAFQQLTSQRNDRISELRAQQAAQNLKWAGNVNYQPRGGGYPSYWADIPMDSTIDDWGMYNRECVSYTAFRVAASGRHMPYWGGVGNANQWDENARRAGWGVDGNPRSGDVAIWNAGYYGHAMYVDSVMGDGSIVISEYNYDWTGRYSQRVLSRAQYQGQGLVFIHFP